MRNQGVGVCRACTRPTCCDVRDVANGWLKVIALGCMAWGTRQGKQLRCDWRRAQYSCGAHPQGTVLILQHASHSMHHGSPWGPSPVLRHRGGVPAPHGSPEPSHIDVGVLRPCHRLG